MRGVTFHLTSSDLARERELSLHASNLSKRSLLAQAQYCKSLCQCFEYQVIYLPFYDLDQESNIFKLLTYLCKFKSNKKRKSTELFESNFLKTFLNVNNLVLIKVPQNVFILLLFFERSTLLKLLL